MSVDEIAAAMRVKRELLEALERNDLSSWPNGLYARAWIRGYSAIVGLDPDDTVDEFCRLYVQGDRRAQGVLLEMAAIVAISPAYRDEFPHDDRRRRATDRTDAAPAPPPPAGARWYNGVVNSVRPLWLRVAALAPAQKTLRRGLH